MDHLEFSKTLSSEQKAEIATVAVWPGLRHLLFHLLLIAVLASLVLLGGIYCLFATLPLGISLVFLFTVEHEATHKTPFTNKRVNEIVGHLCGAVILLPFQWFRYFHLAHHKHTNDPENDPELLAGGKPDTNAAFFWHISGIPYWKGMIRQIIRNAMGVKPHSYVPKSAYLRIQHEAQLLLIIYLSVLIFSIFNPVLLWIWILPMLIGQPFLRLYLLAEHGRCAFVANMLENTRTTYTNRIVRFLAWNMPYHTEHHSFPNVPFYNLPKLNRLMADELRVTEQGYVAFHKENMKLIK